MHIIQLVEKNGGIEHVYKYINVESHWLPVQHRIHFSLLLGAASLVQHIINYLLSSSL